MNPGQATSEFDVAPICTARVHDYLLLGSHSFAADRDYADSFTTARSGVRRLLDTERMFRTTAVSFMLDRGIRQFLDLGAGLPAGGGGGVSAPCCGRDARTRFVHVDNDPAAAAHGSVLVDHDSDSVYLQADAADVGDVVTACVLSGAIDVRRPVGVLAIGLLHLIEPAREPEAIVARYCSLFGPGSAAAITHLTPRFAGKHGVEAAGLIAGPGGKVYPRGRASVSRMFAGLTMVRPGLTLLSHRWRPGVPVSDLADSQVEGLLGGIAVHE